MQLPLVWGEDSPSKVGCELGQRENSFLGVDQRIQIALPVPPFGVVFG